MNTPKEVYRIRIKRGDAEVEVESTDKDYVEAKIQEYLAAGSQLDGVAPAFPVSHPPRAKRPLSVGEFVKQIGPDKKNEIAATLAYFLEYHAGSEEWRPDEVGTKFTDARKPKPANMADLLAKSNFFMKGRQAGFYKLSETGVKWVEGRIANES